MKILILCTGNSCRSQMAEAILQSFDDMIEVYSAGTEPASQVNPLTVEVMKDWNMDLSTYHPKNANQFINTSFDYVITVCDHANDTCPVFEGDVKNRLHIGFEDPAMVQGSMEHKLKEYRRIRDEILVDFYGFYRTEIKK
ncbi:MAG: protein tyrosine phosphatase [Flavobacteriales bacterium]|nr:MAG: protein tyrosine phosphatase [Flavobacteriales bacterium]